MGSQRVGLDLATEHQQHTRHPPTELEGAIGFPWVLREAWGRGEVGIQVQDAPERQNATGGSQNNPSPLTMLQGLELEWTLVLLTH